MTDDLKAEYDEYRAKREAARAEWLEWVRCSGQSNILLSGTGLNTVFAFLNHAANSDLHEKLWAEIERLRAALEVIVGRIGGGNRGAVVVTTEMLAKIAQQGLDGY